MAPLAFGSPALRLVAGASLAGGLACAAFGDRTHVVGCSAWRLRSVRSWAPAAMKSHVGVVVEFDDHAGFGTVRADDGTEYFFHCTAIADGTRTIPVGVRVGFAVEPGRLGRWEASALRPDAEDSPACRSI